MTQGKYIQGRTPQIVTCLLIWILVAGLIGFTRGLPYIQEGAPGPRFMPVVLAVCLGILNVLYFADLFFSKRTKPLIMPSLSELAGPAAYVLLGLSMIVLWERLGVVVTVLLVSAIELKFMERYPWRKSILVGLLISLTTWIIFQFILGVPLPAGIFAWLLVR
ncbi:MAG: tripartite tricarboxylate transporter TctB family protein [Deltaproteobacteria bacterium]|nr:tripartite tricarboxylate transporter TctB family protein [Deltaproteobacteria bacterium]